MSKQSRSFQKILEPFKNFQMPVKHSKTVNMLFKLSKNLPNTPQVVLKGFKTLRELQNASRVVKSFPKRSKSFQKLLEQSKSFQMVFSLSIEGLKRFEDSLEASVCFYSSLAAFKSF